MKKWRVWAKERIGEQHLCEQFSKQDCYNVDILIGDHSFKTSTGCTSTSIYFLKKPIGTTWKLIGKQAIIFIMPI